MRELRSLSGPWVGFWVQDLQRGEMRLTLRFGESSVQGEGSDRVGSFTVSGHHAASGVVGFAKVYPSHRVDYEGTWDGAMIAGRWRIGVRRAFDEGEFEIWPEQDDLAVERMEAALATTA